MDVFTAFLESKTALSVFLQGRRYFFDMYFQFLGLPSAIHSIAVARRFTRVSSRFASLIHSA